MNSPTNTKRTLFSLWVRMGGKVLVTFDSGYPGVDVSVTLMNDPEMWVVVAQDTIEIFEEGLRAEVELETGAQEFVFIPWAAVYQLDSEILEECHTWYREHQAAIARANKPKELVN